MPLDNEQQQEQIDQPESLRETLAANFTAAEASAEAPVDAGRARDEAGRFAAKAADAAQPTTAPTEAPSQAPTAAPTAAELTTWRREMRPLHQKLAMGQALTAEEARQLAEYNVQREREYSTGISTYKAEAQQAASIKNVMQEFMPALQQAGMAPEAWIQNMGRTHAALVYGSPEQKLGIFANVMQSYGITPQALVGYLTGQPDPAAMQQMHQAHAGMQQQTQLQQLQYRAQMAEQQLQQQQMQETQHQLAKFSDASTYPHFEQVRNTMAQLLESGAARDLDEAYTKAVRVDDNAWQAEQQRQAAAAEAKAAADRAAVVARAKHAGGSVRTGSPAGAAQAPQTANLRANLENAFEQVVGAGRV